MSLQARYTQAELAQLAGLAREPINRIEKGTYNDLGVKKLLTLLSLVGAEVTVQSSAPRQGAAPNFIARAVSAANISHEAPLHADELISSLVNGTVLPHKAAHLQVALSELSEANQKGLIEQVSQLAADPKKVARNEACLRAKLGIEPTPA